MPAATVIRAWTNGRYAHLAVRVDNDRLSRAGVLVAVEYVGRVLLADMAGLTGAQQKAALVGAVQAERARSLALQAAVEADIPAITGTVQV